MKILLLSRNRVVQEIVRMAAAEAEAELECLGEIAELRQDRYDLLLMDTTLPVEVSQEHLLLGRSGVIVSEGEEEHEGFDFRIQKPFLPSDILQVIRASRASEFVVQEREKELGAFLDRRERAEAEKEMPTHVLDMEEILKIQMLLEETQKSKEGDVELGEDSREWLGRLFSMKPKRLKKFLKGAEVTITIRFPGEKR